MHSQDWDRSLHITDKTVTTCCVVNIEIIWPNNWFQHLFIPQDARDAESRHVWHVRHLIKIRVIQNVYKRRLLINIGETSASPLFTTERIQPEFSSFSIFLDDNKLNRAAHTMPEVPPHKYRT